MAESFSQRTRNVNASLRRLRAAYRKADSQGELLERELDRLINRKTIVSPESLLKVTVQFEAYVRSVNLIEVPMNDSLRLAGSYV